MNNEKKQQAQNLFYQTDLTKTQIAGMLGISRRSLTYWIREGNWNRLKESAAHLPSILAENCYHIMGHLTESYLSERRLTNPVTGKEIDGLHKLAVTVGKLRNRSTLNESMEMFGFFIDGLRKQNPTLAAEVSPYIEEYLSGRASVSIASVKPQHFTGIGGRIPWLPADNTEQRIDAREDFFSDPDTIESYTAAGIPLPTEEEITTLSEPDAPPPAYTLSQRNADKQVAMDEHMAQRVIEHAAMGIPDPPSYTAPAMPRYPLRRHGKAPAAAPEIDSLHSLTYISAPQQEPAQIKSNDAQVLRKNTIPFAPPAS